MKNTQFYKINIIQEVLANATRKEKEISDIYIEKE